MGIKNVYVLKTHATQAFVQRCEQIFSRPAQTVGPGPHVPARLGGDQQFIAVLEKILAQDLAKVLFGGPVGRSIVVRQVEVRYAPIKCPSNYRPAGLENIGASKVLPQ